jgi:hypothetical protein
MASAYQDSVAVIQLLKAALVEYGIPEAIVSDNGSVFTSEAYRGLLEGLGIEICYIEKGKPWENLIEAQFKIQLRLADAHFEQAQSFAEIQERHAQFVQTFNNTPHWAYQQRSDKLRTPAAVLGWVRGRKVTPEELQKAFRHLQVERVVTKAGYVRIQRFYIYAERGLARKRVSIWLYDSHLQIALAQTLLAHYAYRYNQNERKVTAVDNPQLYRTAYASPQLELWEMDDDQWRKVLERQIQRHLTKNKTDAYLKQLPLPTIAAQLAS